MMENSANRITCQQVRDLDVVSYLDQLGIKPVRIAGNNFWYLSPFREEKTASFKVNRKTNRWYDFGEGTGGSLIDFACRYHQYTIGELLEHMNSFGSLIPHLPADLPPAAENRILVLKERPLIAKPLLSYLLGRRIPVAVAEAYCREVSYQLSGKNCYGIGFKNDKGGFEIRNAYFKGSSSPKWITTLDSGADRVHVFEGFIDFLSFRVIYPHINGNFLILNSLSFFEHARPFMERHQTVHLYLDRDNAGFKLSQYAASLSAAYQDQSSLYQRHKDLNDFLCFFGNSLPDSGQLIP